MATYPPLPPLRRHGNITRAGRSERLPGPVIRDAQQPEAGHGKRSGQGWAKSQYATTEKERHLTHFELALTLNWRRVSQISLPLASNWNLAVIGVLDLRLGTTRDPGVQDPNVVLMMR